MAKKKGKAHVMLVLDATGSMERIKQQTISAFNEYIQTLKADKDADYLFSLLMFNSAETKLVYDAVPVKKVAELDWETYWVRALTPLYDAVARGINSMGKEKKVAFVIQTDGEENDSKEFTAEKVRKMIEKKTDKGWQFVFLGAGQDAWVTGQHMGISRGQTISYDPQQQVRVFNMMSKGVMSYAQAAAPTTNLFDKIDIRGEDDEDNDEPKDKKTWRKSS